jgi:BlaI family penicillinase repressor
METLWTKGPLTIRQIQEAFEKRKRPAYTTVQTMVYRLETKKALCAGQFLTEMPPQHFRKFT